MPSATQVASLLRQSLTACAFEAVDKETVQNAIVQNVAAQTQQIMDQAMQQFREDLLAHAQKMFNAFSESQRGSEVHEVHEVE